VSEPGKPVGDEPKKAGPLQVFRAVLWSFIGIRKSSGYADDVAKIRPVQAIVAGLIVAALFVAGLVVLVRFLTAK
jgi:amino acid transporter